MVFTETFTDFINEDTPGFVWATVGGVPEIGGLFDNNYVDPMGMDASAPVLHCIASDIPTVAQGTALIIGSVSYTVIAVKPDGGGLVILRLQEA